MVIKKVVAEKIIIAAVLLLTTYFVVLAMGRQLDAREKEKFAAPGRDWQSQKKVEDYCVERLRMTQADLDRMKDRNEVSFRVNENTTVDAIIRNLAYYGFVRSENALRYTLEHTNDTVPGKDRALKVGTNGTIDINANYRISENMTAWEIADVLLNKPEYFAFDEYGYLFMP